MKFHLRLVTMKDLSTGSITGYPIVWGMGGYSVSDNKESPSELINADIIGSVMEDIATGHPSSFYFMVYPAGE